MMSFAAGLVRKAEPTFDMMPPSEPAAPLPAMTAHALARLLLAYERRLLDLPENIDDSWIVRLFGVEAALAWRAPHPPGTPDSPAHAPQAARPAQPVRAARVARLRAALRLAPLPPAALLPVAHRLAVLEPALLAKVLALRALYARRAALRRCVDRAVIEPLRALLGAATLQSLLGCAGGGVGGVPLPELAPAADSCAWAWCGYAALLRDQVWTDDTVLALIRVTLPAQAPADTPADAAPQRTIAGHTSDDFFTDLPTLMPELSWLFG